MELKIGQIYDRKSIPEHSNNMLGITNYPKKIQVIDIRGDSVTCKALGLSPLVIPRKHYIQQSEIEHFYMFNIADTLEYMVRLRQK